MYNPNERVVQVAVIGAGVAGLKAASTLVNKLGDAQVVVLEAQDRLGGRILTDTTSSKLGLNYDLGAAWFHDSLTNPVLKEALEEEDKSVFDFEKDAYFDDKDTQFFSSDHDGPIDVASLKINRVSEDLEKFIELYFVESLEVPDSSLEEVNSKFFEKYGKFLTDEQRHYCRNIIRHYELWYGITWDLISGKHAIMDHNGRNLLNKNGYKFLIEKLTSNIPSQSVYTEQQVVSIDRKNKVHDKKVLIQTKQGLRIYCDYIVVTVPQSVLQLKSASEYGITWNPPLPSNITSALESIHFGALGKVIFEFDEVWWDPEEDRFDILADITPGFVASQEIKSPPVPFSYPAFVVNFASVHKEKNLPGGSLVVLTQSPLTQYLESSPASEAWKFYKPMLAKLALPGKNITEPINIIKTNWTNNPYIRGSYAALHTDDDPSELIIQLSGEFDGCGLIDKNIRFAGEHTISDGAGCVHGAYMSGLREADWIINDLSDSISNI
ncbi:predicted protein [Scheffersomyces stipitis CBS 6054]|uniref:Amine oxidase domain-containing protein n=1 Tax=Scheffersomyces stipitis (strain ATCC 58785 / CBS 6054 / NBRC 10063 / NRRL Y-11545) TaxID=322104 RepID=A3LS39_PICST|nr:predicted protein [Scheffersomyces stipitis CBS 6054]ABN65495.2 predicted protein [Scheffersomyces stipitis CBS 6054]KAG2733862.1 hypothetical protein G9P44_003387 [Scheffersomyces stipitis]